jgi:hypothetical protein
MVSQNEPGQYLPALFVDRLIALGDAPPEKREYFASKSTKSQRESLILQYLSGSILWDALLKLARRPLYRTLTFHIAEYWRSIVLMHDVSSTVSIKTQAAQANCHHCQFLLILLDDMNEQYQHIESAIKLSGLSKSFDLSDLLGEHDWNRPNNTKKSGTDNHLSTLATKMDEEFPILEKLQDHPLFKSEPLEFPFFMEWVTKRQREWNGQPVGSPYLFGKMVMRHSLHHRLYLIAIKIPLTGDFAKEGAVSVLLLKWKYIMSQEGFPPIWEGI